MGQPELTRVLAIYLEPAPYVVDYVAKLRAVWPDGIDVFYVSAALTQPWSFDFTRSDDDLLPASLIAAVVTIRNLLATRRYRILSLAGWGHPALCAALCLARWFAIPVVMETDTSLPQHQSVFKQLIKSLTYPLLFKLPSYFLPAGSRQKKYLCHYGVDASRIRILQMSVDVSKISRLVTDVSGDQKRQILKRYNVPEDSTKLLYVGRLEAHKGIADLLQAFRRLATELDDVCLLIAGSGGQRKLVERCAAENERIHYLGRVPEDQIFEAYAMADVLILPSRFEPWGLVVNEAMASGLPVIVTESVGCAEDLVKAGQCGLIVPARAPEKLCDALRTLTIQPCLRTQMGQAGRRHIAGWTLENSATVATTAWRKVAA